ncbi:MAG: basic amino acid ABC transporter substrate-binding protein [Lachnospiraceae bacterium]|nr:basic amino acid ABC transporter substrate-binding protein [Lachnospiraceae bacterium]
MKKLLALVLTGVLGVSVLTACGSSSSAPSAAAETASTEVAAASTETETASASGSALDKDTLIIGTNAAFPPFEYAGDDGTPAGFDVDLINAIGEKLGKKVEVKDMEFDSLVASIGNKIDIAIAGMTVTEERQKMVDFSDPYYEAVQNVIVVNGSEIASADDLKNKKIGVQLGTTGDFIASDIEGSEVSQYNKAVDAVNDLLNGRVDCVIIDANPAQEFVSQHAEELTALEGTQFGFETENYAIAMPKGDAALVEAVNQALKELKEDGTFDKLVAENITGE